MATICIHLNTSAPEMRGGGIDTALARAIYASYEPIRLKVSTQIEVSEINSPLIVAADGSIEPVGVALVSGSELRTVRSVLVPGTVQLIS